MQFRIFDVEKYKSDMYDKKIIIYGDAWMAHLTAIYLKANNIEQVIYSNYLGENYAPFEKVISFKELVGSYAEKYYLILWAVSGYSKFESLEFEKNGIHAVYSVRRLWKISENIDTSSWKDIYHYEYEKRDDFFFFEDVIENPQKIYLYSLDAMVTEKCSLKCRDCSNLMQYYQNPQDCNIEQLKQNIDFVLKRVDKIHDLRILGGEPFMNMNFVKLIDWYQGEEKIGKITVLSNGTIFPNKESILESLKSSKVLIRFSDYGNLSRALKQWVIWCQENNVRFQVAKIDVWESMGHLERHNYTEHRLRDIYGNCECRNVPTILGNKLFNCAYAANAFNLGAIAVNEALKDYLEINENLTGKQIDHFLYDRPYLEACKYCGGRNYRRASVPPNIQIKKPLYYQKQNQVFERPVCGGEDSAFTVLKQQNNDRRYMKELVSVVVPVYNAEKTVEKCVRSIMEQTYSRIEIFLVDDGSTDCSVDICEVLAKEDIYKRIKVIRNEHKGVVTTRNTGILLSMGKYITFVDADDFLELDSVEKLVAGIEEGQSDLCFMGWYHERKRKRVADSLFDRGQSLTEILYTFPQEGTYEGIEIIRMLVEHLYLQWDGLFDSMWNKIFVTRKLQEICGQIDERIILGEDLLYVFMYLIESKKIRVLDYVGYHYTEVDREEAQHKYDYDKLTFSLRYLRSVLDDIANNKTKIVKSLCDTIYYHLLNLLIGVTNRQRKYDKLYYYPWYGRLNSKRIVLYGAGDVGKSYYKSIQEDIKTELVAWVDKNASCIREEYLYPVEDVDCLKYIEFDFIIVGVYAESIYKQIKSELMESIPEEKIIWNPTKLANLY